MLIGDGQERIHLHGVKLGLLALLSPDYRLNWLRLSRLEGFLNKGGGVLGHDLSI
jgi:hypothetical protein